MKPIEPSENDAPLRAMLREWRVTTPLPPRFQEQVWRRIEKADTRTESVSWSALVNWLVSVTTRPALAVAYATVLLFAGLGAGYWHARETTANWDRTLAQRYVQAIDPFQQTSPN